MCKIVMWMEMERLAVGTCVICWLETSIVGVLKCLQDSRLVLDYCVWLGSIGSDISQVTVSLAE
jgi:hypothetical protein